MRELTMAAVHGSPLVGESEDFGCLRGPQPIPHYVGPAGISSFPSANSASNSDAERS